MKDLTMTAQHARTAAPLALLCVLASVICLSAWPSIARASDNSKDMVVFGGTQTLEAGQDVEGDLVVLGGNADVYGHVHGDAVAIGGRIFVAPEGQVDGSFVSLGGTIDNQSASSPGNARSGRHRVVPAPPIPPTTPDTTDTVDQDSSSWVPFLLFDAALVLFAFLLFPVKTRDAMQYLVENPLIACIAGFFSPMILTLVLITLAITIIGIPLIPVVVIMAAVGYLIGKAALAAFIGGRLVEVARVESPKPIITMLVGLGLLTLISMFGWEGIVIYFSVGALSLGVALYGLGRVLNQRRRAASYVPPIPPSAPEPAHEFTPPAGPAPTGPPAVQ